MPSTWAGRIGLIFVCLMTWVSAAVTYSELHTAAVEELHFHVETVVDTKTVGRGRGEAAVYVKTVEGHRVRMNENYFAGDRVAFWHNHETNKMGGVNRVLPTTGIQFLLIMTTVLGFFAFVASFMWTIAQIGKRGTRNS